MCGWILAIAADCTLFISPITQVIHDIFDASIRDGDTGEQDPSPQANKDDEWAS